MSLAIASVLELELFRDGSMVMVSLCYYYGSTQPNGGIHGGKSASVGSDGVEMTTIPYISYTHAFTS